MLNATSRVLCAAIAVTLVMLAARADAGVISGVYTSRNGAPLANRQLHFENHISGDMFLTRTGVDGSFSSDLPPGTYDLRAERGLVLKSKIRVESTNLSIGRVNDGAPFDVRRPFERQGIGPALVDTEAPATAHIEKPGSAPPQAPAPSSAQSTASSTAAASGGP